MHSHTSLISLVYLWSVADHSPQTANQMQNPLKQFIKLVTNVNFYVPICVLLWNVQILILALVVVFTHYYQ